jgi:ribonuclease BN (tRNA processing enzyme)
MLQLTILGSGTSVPNPERFPAGYLVEVDGVRLCVDLGPGVLRRLAAVGLDLDAIDAVLLTHYHTDHCADVAALLFALRNPRYHRRRPLVIVGARGLRTLIDHLTAAWPWLAPREVVVEFREIEPGMHRIAGAQVEAIAIEHTKESLGYRIGDTLGAVVALTGDAIWCDALIPLARGAELFVCDSAFPTANPGVGHMTPTEAGRAARLADAKHLILTHFYPECDGYDLIAEAAAEFDGEISMARDLAVHSVSPRA